MVSELGECHNVQVGLGKCKTRYHHGEGCSTVHKLTFSSCNNYWIIFVIFGEESEKNERFNFSKFLQLVNEDLTYTADI
jgi:hypothetical protein